MLFEFSFNTFDKWKTSRVRLIEDTVVFKLVDM